MDFDTHFKAYEALVSQIEAAFEQVRAKYPRAVRCDIGCSDCCFALFDITLVEALYINRKFNETYKGAEKEALLEKANRADREIAKLKHRAHRDLHEGKNENQILEEMAEQRVRCPLLNDENRCDLYASRPITCRLYGIPVEIGGKARSCRLSAFEAGKAYPAIKMEQIHQKLYDISFALAQGIQSKYSQLADMLVPLSMALIADYSEDYLGVKSTDKELEKDGSKE